MSTHTSTNTSGHITGPADLVTALRHALGDAHVLTGADAAGYLTDQHGRLTGQALAVARPADTAQVAQLVRLCRAHRTPIVAQGGNTGLMGGATPDASGHAVLLSLARLNRVRELEDAIGEPHIGEIAADCFMARVELDRTPGQRESVTRVRIVCWCCRRRRR